MDYASTTPVDERVVEAMLPYFREYFGNPSSLHSYGTKTREVIEVSRKRVADLISAEENEILFTSGGTEADNLAIRGIAHVNKDKKKLEGPHIITSSIEHPAVLETCKDLEKEGFEVKYLDVNRYGVVDLKQLQTSISEGTFLISVMFANNEIGTIEPIEEIGKIAREHNVLFHTDAVQAIGKVDIDVKKLNIDLLSISSHKIYGPKGVGALFVREGIKLKPILTGGGHEKGLRSGTENVPGIVGFGEACKIVKERMERDIEHMQKLRDRLIEGVLNNIEESYLNGHPEKRLVNNAHFRFTAIEGESLILSLDERGIAASTGSACSSKKLKPSHVLLAIGLSPVEAHGSLRLTLGRYNTQDDVDYVLEVLPEVVNKLREMSPLWNRS
ncbi:MAG TPA: cysteine desulfurase NifS [Thermoplasmatales archaeon]|nr:cysteine desulfurase NifS [Thermoplasmatales archaeon]